MQVPNKSSENFSTADVASRAGVHRDTLLRWLRRGLVQEPTRDRHGWRSFSEAEVRAVIAFAESTETSPASSRQDVSSHLEAMGDIDWDFQGAKTNYLTHRIHPYPAKFIPQIPNALIQELSSVGDTVGDIFCGSGTTPVEALVLKRHAVGLDANPLACLIAKSKTTAIDEADKEALHVLISKSREFSDGILARSGGGDDLFPTDRFVSSAWRPGYQKLTFWFDEHVIEELAELLKWCRQLPSEAARNLALTSFSSIVVTVSRQDSDTRYVRREKNIPQGETMRRFARALDQATLAAAEFTDIVEPRFQRYIIEANLLDAPEIPRLDLVVCSPPYPNAYSYHLYHMTRMTWLGMDQPKFKREEIGSHRKYSSPAKNGATVETFRSEFVSIFEWLANHLKLGGYACFVVGNSTMKGLTYNNADILSEVSQRAGFREAMRIPRTLQSTKKAFNPVIGKIKQEQILVLENLGRK